MLRPNAKTPTVRYFPLPRVIPRRSYAPFPETCGSGTARTGTLGVSTLCRCRTLNRQVVEHRASGQSGKVATDPLFPKPQTVHRARRDKAGVPEQVALEPTPLPQAYSV